MGEGNGTLLAFAVLTVVIAVGIYVNMDSSGMSAMIAAGLIGAFMALFCIGIWAVAQKINK